MANEPIGRELLNIPFGEIIREVAMGISEAQFELDKSSMLMAEQMSGQRVLREAATGEPILDANNAPHMIDSRVFFGHQIVEGGTDAQITAIKGRLGTVVSVNLSKGGSGYEASSTEVRITGGAPAANGTPAVARATVTAGAVTGIVIENPGSGYTRTPTITIVDTRSPASGTGAKATATIDPTDKIIGFQVANPGTGYLVTPDVRLEGGGGSGARAVATVDGTGKITRVDIADHGSGYTSAPTVTVVGTPSLLPLKRSMIELGFSPNFYHFVDTVIEMKLALRVNRGETGRYQISVSTVDANYASSYNYALEMATVVRTKIVPIPPPVVLEEQIRILIDQNRAAAEQKLL